MTDSAPTLGRRRRLGLFALIFITGVVVFMVGGYLTIPAPGPRAITKTALPAILLAVTLTLYRSEGLKGYWQLSLAFFIASSGFLLAFWFSEWSLRLLNPARDTMQGLALIKLSESLLIVVAILALTRIAGGDMGSIYLKKGNLRLGLGIGLGTFSIFAALFLLQARGLDVMHDSGRDVSTQRLVEWAPWILTFVLSNAFMEELHFRGLFLRKLEPFLGAHMSNLVIALIFTVTHTPVRYTADVIQFLVVLLPLALAWGLLMQRSDAIWGSVLFHAGADLLIVVGILESASP